jgi:hypothetical protein
VMTDVREGLIEPRGTRRGKQEELWRYQHTGSTAKRSDPVDLAYVRHIGDR